MNKVQRFKKKVHDYLFDHIVLKYVLEYTYSLIICALAALIFAFGFSIFARGVTLDDGSTTMNIVTGGASGISQSIRMIFELFLGPDNELLEGVLIEAIFYTVVNLPLLIFSFKKIGIRFSIFTAINVVLTSLLMPVVRNSSIIIELAENPLISSEPLTRTLFSGVCTGLSSAIAFKGFFSTGGIDILGYYFSLRKSANTGKYSGILNVVNITIYTILFIGNITKYPSNYQQGWSEAIISFLYGLVYLAVVVVVIDLINVRNKKVQLQIVTNMEHLSDVLIANFPHSVTITKAVGGYSHKEKYILLMTISSVEQKKVVKVVQTADPKAFIQVFALHQVFGKFFINPIK